MAQANPATQSAPTAPPMRWQAGGARAVILSFIFLLLLPFYLSIGPMLFLRLRHGLWVDTLGLAVLGALFSALMLLILMHLVHSVRSRVRLDENEVRFTLPAVHRGPTPLFRFNTRTIP